MSKPKGVLNIIEEVFASMRLQMVLATQGSDAFKYVHNDRDAVTMAQYALKNGWTPEQVIEGLALYIKTMREDHVLAN